MSDIVERLRKLELALAPHFDDWDTEGGPTLDGASDEIERLHSCLRSQGRIINHINEKNAKLARKVHSLGFQASGNPTPRIVRQIKEIRAAAGTNSVSKIVALIERGRQEQ